MTATWGVLAEPPADVVRFRRWLLVRAYRRHRGDIEARNHIEWAAALVKRQKGRPDG